MSEKTFAIISSQEAKIEPYRELSIEDKQYLEEKFDPTDSNRPYVKSGYHSKTPEGKMRGFLRRTKLPKGLVLGELPKNNKWWKIWI